MTFFVVSAIVSMDLVFIPIRLVNDGSVQVLTSIEMWSIFIVSCVIAAIVNFPFSIIGHVAVIICILY